LSSLVHEPAGETKPLLRSVQFEVEMARSGGSGMDDGEMAWKPL
jgi:hypothetical protein